MPVEVLLMADVKDLGSEGDVVKVSDGYARNYLLPRGVAAPVTEATRRKLAKQRAERAAELESQLGGAREMAGRLAKASVTVTVKTGDGEKLYGSVTASDIADALKAQGIELDRGQIELDSAIKDLGVFDVSVRLHPQVDAKVKVWVVEE
ncbi:MAG: 50S ribosomal protein L9 [Lentisphaerae bacterium]|nr:50S ribosomal protein L9 [Lentisphaerota bacterium]